MKNKIRKSNIELLRILSMFMIIISHWNVHSSLDKVTINNPLNIFLINNTVLGNIGVILFFMISGYFAFTSKNNNVIQKVCKLVLEVLFYSITIFILLFVTKNINFNIKDCIRSFLPITFKSYWFVTVYIVISLFSPYINKFLNNLTLRDYNNLLLISILLFIVIPTFTTGDYYGNELIQGLLFYSLGFYINKFTLNKYDKYLKYIFFSSILLLFLSTFILQLLSNYYSFFLNRITFFYSRTSLLVLVLCISLFKIFCNMKDFENKVINFIASNTFAVYLISDNFIIRPIIWDNIFMVTKYANSYLLIVNMFFSVLITFAVCIITEIIRKNTIERITNKILERKFNY